MTETPPGHPRHELNEFIHAPVRPSIRATLAAAERVEFKYLRDRLEVSDSLLSNHLAALEAAGFVFIGKGYVGKRPRTWLGLSPAGADAYDRYLAALRRIVEASPPE